VYPGAPEGDREVAAKRVADEKAVVEPREQLSTDLTFFAAVRSAAVVGFRRGLFVVVLNDLFREDGGFHEVPVAEVNDLLARLRVA